MSRDTVFKEIRPGAGFETGDFVKEKLGGLPWNDSVVDGSAHILIATARPKNFPKPGGHKGDWNSPGKGGTGQQQQQ